MFRLFSEGGEKGGGGIEHRGYRERRKYGEETRQKENRRGSGGDSRKGKGSRADGDPWWRGEKNRPCDKYPNSRRTEETWER